MRPRCPAGAGRLAHARRCTRLAALPLAAPHLDAEHGHHCDDLDCVMYWLNEGATDLVTYAKKYAASGDVVLFDDACLADAGAAASR